MKTLLPTKSTFEILIFGPSVILNLSAIGLRTARQRLVIRHDLGFLESLLHHHFANDVGDLLLGGLIHEAVEANRDAELAQTLLDLRLLNGLGSLVVDRVLDPLPLFHVVHDDLADDAVRKRKIEGLDLQIVQEVGGPEPLVVADNRLFGGLVVRLPDVL